MEYEAKEVACKDGRTATLRSAQLGDAAEMVRFWWTFAVRQSSCWRTRRNGKA